MLNTSARVHASGPRNAKLAIVGMAPAKDEFRQGMPFVGYSGKEVNNALAAFQIPRETVFVTNVCEFFVEGKIFDFVPTDILATEVTRLEKELREVKPNCVLVLGDEPFQILTGKHGILKWRGSILESSLIPGLKVVPSVHPAWYIRGMWKWAAIFKYLDVRRAIEESAFPDIRYPKRTSIIGPSFNDVIEYIELCKKQDILSFDYETFYGSEIACVGIGYKVDEAMCIPFMRGNGSSYWSVEEEVEIWKAYASLMQSPVPKVGQNLAFEWIFSWLHNVYPQNIFIDTMLLHHCLYPDWGKAPDVWGKKDKGALKNPGHGLAFINSQYTKTPYYKDDGRTWDPRQGDSQLWIYNTYDVMCTLECALKMWDVAKGDNLQDVYTKYYTRPFHHAMLMEWDGIKVDADLRVETKKIRLQQVGELQAEVDKVLGYHLNVRSPKQKLELLYNVKGYQLKKNRKTRQPTADKETLEFFARKKGDDLLWKVIHLINIYDEISDVLDTPLDAQNKIHCHYKLGGTDGGRWSSTASILGTGTNLQNIRREGIARLLFLPD